MSFVSKAEHTLASFTQLSNDLAILDLNQDLSELHGRITGLIVAGASEHAEAYLRGLSMNKSGPQYHQAMNALFSLYTITHTCLYNFEFNFQLLLPDDNYSLQDRLYAFTNWTQGFLEGLDMSGLTLEDFESEETIEVLQHLEDFADMEVENIDASEQDEHAYVDVTEYLRLAVMQLFCDLQKEDQDSAQTSRH
jgi:uncharacterized protein YgfB (UPF0149 family)